MPVKRKLGPKLYISRRFPSGIRFGLFPFRSLLLGESRLVSFPPPTKMLPFGGFPLLEGAPGSEESGERSHSGIPGSKAACAYPGRFRGLPRPSSALKPSHSPDGGCVVGPFGGVCLAFGEHLCWCVANFCLCVVSCERCAHSPLRSCIRVGAELRLFFNSVSYVAGFF